WRCPIRCASLAWSAPSHSKRGNSQLQFGTRVSTGEGGVHVISTLSMPLHTNSASRLKALLSKALGESDGTQVMEVWARLFGIVEDNQNKKAALVSERLRWMYHETESISKQMKATGYSDHLYSGAIANIEHALSTMILPGSWNQAKQYIKRETILALDFCSEILPDEESQISEEDISCIRNLVSELRELLQASELPTRLIDLIQHHIDLISRALDGYPISGAKTLREAARTGLGELIEIKEAVEASRTAPEISKLGETWKKVNSVADAALKIEKLAQLGQKAWAAIEGLI
ncbi:MAG: hypothetical protein AB1421_14230, partial [Pseudomonadota bacterium]